MAAIERAGTVGRQRADRLLRDLGREIRGVRVARGVSQHVVASAAGLTQSQVSMIERGLYPGVPMDSLARVGATLGLELSVRFFPAGEPIRDRAHATLLERFRKAVGERWEWAAEVPLPIPGDRRAWDRRLRGHGVAIGVEGETRPTDMQELQRRLGLKKRDGQVDRLILVLADTDWCRRIVRLNDIESMFPVPGKVALGALAEGRDPGGDAIVMI
ncbi:MAG TPA: helix-turn-helix domain-containing protein [Candidatus Limnocylindrales bacterium]|nr:helix-turn-helix domain-containing protein [Candidatus Limnocylindrales bacterium]